MSGSKKTFLALISLAFTSAGIGIVSATSYTWSTMANVTAGQYWSAALSNDGTTMLGSARSAYIRRSTDSGSTWAQTSGTSSGAYFFSISIDGTKIFAAGNEGGFNYSSTDSGATWIARTPGVTTSRRPCMTDDGRNIMVVPYPGTPSLSTDGGATWSSVAGLGTGNWFTCAMSVDGNYRYALKDISSTYKRSSDGGATWSAVTLPTSYWYDLGISNDGRLVYLSDQNNRIYKSTDYGQTFTWVNQTTTMTAPQFLAVSGDGQTIVVFDANSTIKISTDGAVTWQAETTLGSKNWYAGDISDDGTRIVAPVATNGNYIYKNVILPATSLSLTSGGSTVLTYRSENTIRATSNYAGKVTFFANGKKIGNCVGVSTVALVATCNYKPTIHGTAIIRATVVPTNPLYAAVTTELFRTKIQPRSNTR